MPIAPTSFVPELVEQVFQRIQEDLKQSGIDKLTKQHHIELYALFGESLQRALQIIDKQLIKVYCPESGVRELFEITEKPNSANVIRLFAGVNYCSCPFFTSNVLSLENKYYTCAHVLAVRLGNIIDSQATHNKKSILIETLPKHKFNFLLAQMSPLVDNLSHSDI